MFLDYFFDVGREYEFNGDSIEILVPGVKREDIRIGVEGRHIDIEYTDRKKNKRHYRFIFPGGNKDIGAKLEDGILTIKFDLEKGERREIEVK